MDEAGFENLRQEITNWRRLEKPVRLFLRDDDAIEVTDHLARLERLINSFNVPLLMAVIPQLVKPELAERVGANPLVSVAVHGISHTNHAPPHEKKCELGTHQPVDITLGELLSEREKLMGMFNAQFTTILVPPWNRIAKEVALRVGEIGFTAISGFTWKTPDTPLPWINTHVDIIDWKHSKRGKDADRLAQELSENLKISREQNFAPIGILTHHLEHDETAWTALSTLIQTVSPYDHVKWLGADQLI